MEIVSLDEFEAAREAHELQVVSSTWTADYPEPSTFLLDLFHSDSSFNDMYYFGFENPALDGLLEYARSERNPAYRDTLYLMAEQLILSEAPLIPISYLKRFYLMREDITGFPMGRVYIPPFRHLKVN